MRIITAESINRHAAEDLKRFISASEEEYRYQLEYAADGIICNLNKKPVILINGPSGSGKTVSAYRIKQVLEKKGYCTHIISMDDYFLPLDDSRNDCGESGEVDLESPKRLDVSLLNKQLNMIFDCEEIEIPRFDFTTQTRKKGVMLRINAGDIVIMEGIHALNPAVTGSVLERASKVYVSVRTRIKAEHMLHPSRIRLMRRLVRDKLFRNRSFSDTIKNFKNVERGEKLYIMPFKGSADYDIDTFLHFEPCVYKTFLYGGLSETYENEAVEILSVLNRLNEIKESFVPPFSSVREFIGGNELMK